MKKLLLLFVLMLVSVTSAYAAVAGLQVSLLNQMPNPAQAGNNLQVQVLFNNVGATPVKDILVEAIPEYPFTLPEGVEARQRIPVIPAYPDIESTATLTYDLMVSRDATPGTYSAKFRYSLNNGIGWSLVDVPIAVSSKIFSENIEIDKTSIIPGNETPITFTIHNLGGAPLQNALFSWSDPKGIILPVGSGNSRYVSFIGPGESEQLQYIVMASVNAPPDLYTLNMNLQYEVSGTNQTNSKNTLSTTAGIFVGGQTDFDVAFSESSAGQTSLSVANIGITPAYSVTVRVPDQAGFRVDGTTVAIVGNLDKGDYTLVSFQLTQTGGGRNASTAAGAQGGAQGYGGGSFNRTGAPSGGAQRVMPQGNITTQGMLKVIVEYTDGAGKRRSVEKTVPVQFKQSTGAAGAMGAGYGRPGQSTASSAASTWTKVWETGLVLAVIVVVIYLGRISSKKGKKTA
jgi:hypothetical protein